MFSFRHEHHGHALAWLAGKREEAERGPGFIAIAGFLISLVVLGIAATSPYYALLNYKSNRPSIVFESSRLDWTRGTAQSSIHLAFQNTGTRAARHVSATIGSVTPDGKSVSLLGQLSPLGYPVYPSPNRLFVNVPVATDKLRELLVLCVAYSAEDQQSFSDIQAYQLIGWPPREDQQSDPFPGGSVDRETYARISGANTCTRLTANKND